MRVLDSKTKTETKILKTVELDKKNKLTIEKIMSGDMEGQYTIISHTKKLFFFKNSTLAAYNIETNFDGNKIVKIEYGVFRMLNVAVDFAKDVINEKWH